MLHRSMLHRLGIQPHFLSASCLKSDLKIGFGAARVVKSSKPSQRLQTVISQTKPAQTKSSQAAVEKNKRSIYGLISYLFLSFHLLVSVFLVNALLVTTSANAKSRYEIGDVVGKWQIFSKKNNDKLFSVAIRYDAATNTYIGKIDSLGKKLTQLKVCKACRGKLKNHSLLGLDVLWGVKPQLDKEWQFTGSYDSGEMLNPLTGKTQSITLTVSSSKGILKAQRHVSKFKRVGVTEMWMRIK